jgi:hypothetical protein
MFCMVIFRLMVGVVLVVMLNFFLGLGEVCMVIFYLYLLKDIPMIWVIIIYFKAMTYFFCSLGVLVRMIITILLYHIGLMVH